MEVAPFRSLGQASCYLALDTRGMLGAGRAESLLGQPVDIQAHGTLTRCVSMTTVYLPDVL